MAINRISTYLDEDEVDEQVSTLKKGKLSASDNVAEGLGIERGIFKWNEIEEQKDEAPDKSVATNGSSNGHGSERTPISGEDDSATAVDTGSTAEEERRFELTDINVMFPEEQLTVITGPTASGKTALLVRINIFNTF